MQGTWHFGGFGLTLSTWPGSHPFLGFCNRCYSFEGQLKHEASLFNGLPIEMVIFVSPKHKRTHTLLKTSAVTELTSNSIICCNCQKCQHIIASANQRRRWHVSLLQKIRLIVIDCRSPGVGLGS